MCFKKGELRNETISENSPNYSLSGKVGVTFQNYGCAVVINGLKVLTGESFAINVPNVILTNDISILFTEATNRKLAVAFVVLEIE